jgi:hypothetical protein
MKALSIRQPWAWAILHAGKDIENRSWKPGHPDRRFRGPFLIHSGLGMTKGEYQEFVYLTDQGGIPLPPGITVPHFDALQRGGIVGRAFVVEVALSHPSPWFFGPIGLVLAHVHPTPFIPLKGALGFFDVPDDIAKTCA